VLNEGLLNGLKAVGKRFDRNSGMVSDMLVSARAINESMEILKPMLLPPGRQPIGRACIGTVRGDLHDVGKNIVRLMLESRGIEIVDLGVDVPPEAFVRAVIEDGCELVCCSALLTATVPEMQAVIRALRTAGVRDRVLVMVGGIPVTAAYAKRIGADIWSSDGFDAAEKAEAALLERRRREQKEKEEPHA
jgi:methylmalonyl-CoA mutase cobalamin-binding domain/chain